jgi:hypothetical protein
MTIMVGRKTVAMIQFYSFVIVARVQKEHFLSVHNVKPKVSKIVSCE